MSFILLVTFSFLKKIPKYFRKNPLETVVSYTANFYFYFFILPSGSFLTLFTSINLLDATEVIRQNFCITFFLLLSQGPF